jgi:hypothetical protein
LTLHRSPLLPLVAAAMMIALALAGCGAAQTPSGNAALDAIRRAAQERPNDPEAQARWAEAELLMAGGDAEAAERAIARALELAPENPRLHFLHAMERHVHGDPDVALDAYLRTITLARTSRDPMAPALAEVAIAYAIEFDDGVPGFASMVRAALEPVHADPGSAGAPARHTIGSLLLELAYRRGDLEGVARLAAAQGCPTEARVAGPFGPRHLLHFDQPLAPEEPGPLEGEHALGPGRGNRSTRTIQPRGCAIHLGNGPVAGPGTTYAETTLRAPTDGDYLVRVESPNSVELFVDDHSIARVDRRSEPLGRITYHPVHLGAGDHRVMVKTTTRHPNPVLIVSLIRGDGRAASEGPGGDIVDAQPEASSPLGTVLRAAQYAARADFVHARETLAPAAREGDATSTVLMLASIIALSDPLTGGQVASDEARRILMQAADRDPRAWYPRLQLANLEPDELTRIGLLREATRHWPEILTLPLTLVDALEARGWDADVEAVIAGARGAVPDACRPRRAASNAALRRGRAEEVGALAEELVACDARSDARLQHFVRQRRWDDASREVARIATLEPASSRYATLDAQLTLARGRGDDAEIERLLAALSELMPRSESVVVMQTDRLLAAGNEQAARARLSAALREEPDSMASMRRLLRIIGGDDPMRPFRQDGARVIREFESSGRSYDGPKVLVLDYTVVRVFEDGSSLELTHNIMRLQSEEAVDQEGEFSPPDDAQLLTLRTIKADGRRLEPDEIQGKDTISMPSLAVGDYVEFEYVRARPAPSGFPSGAVGDRFYFQSFEVPFDRSELTVIVPESIRPVIDPRGEAPSAEETVEDGLRVLRFRVRESRPRVVEPGSVSAREYLPSVLWGYNATWEAYVESLRDVLADRDIRDPAHVALVREIVGGDGSASPEQRARRIYHWVIENIEDANEPFGQAATMVHARTGNRTRVLRYLLRLAGIEAELALARSFANDATEGTVADDETYSFLVVRMQGSSGPIWLWPGARGTTFGYLPLEPAIRGQEALVLDARGARDRVSDPGSDGDRADIVADVRLDGEGGAHVAVVETFHGANAVAWRAQLEGVPAAQLEDAFARQYVAQIANGARMTELRITGREVSASEGGEQPLVLRYAFDVASLGRLERDAHVVPQLYGVALVQSFARLARRTTTQVVAGGARDVVMRVHMPEGAAPPVLPQATTIRGPHEMSATWRATVEETVVTIERHLRMPRARITTEEYPELVRFTRAVDDIEDQEIRVELR